MKLIELAQDDLSTAYYDPANDKISGRTLGDTRKEKLTLRKINRLKKMRAMDTLENLKQQDLLAVMYGAPEGDAAGAPPAGGMPF